MVQKYIKYLVCQKELIVEYNTQKKEADLENAKKAVAEFKRRISAEIGRQERLNIVEKKDFIKGELLVRYIVRILYKQNNRKFKAEYLRNLKRNQQR